MNETSNSINKVSLFSAPDIECDGCANAIRNALGKMPGVTVVAVSVEDQTVAVTHEPTTAPDAAIIAALDKAGFPATVRG
ncbi:MAG: heavy-metal-associated domain-containing protein [Armatimonadetes bacterium]|nr:heavy-metal-associated domain-containing protein [Armatimonadota bacterium]